MDLKYILLVLVLFFISPSVYADKLPGELFGVKLGSSLSELKGVEDTRAYQTVSFLPPSPDKRLDTYWASYDKENKISGIHGYKFEMQPQGCRGLMKDIISTTSRKYDIVFQLKKRKSGSEYYFSESEDTALVIDCRNKETRLRFALAVKRKG